MKKTFCDICHDEMHVTIARMRIKPNLASEFGEVGKHIIADVTITNAQWNIWGNNVDVCAKCWSKMATRLEEIPLSTCCST